MIIYYLKRLDSKFAIADLRHVPAIEKERNKPTFIYLSEKGNDEDLRIIRESIKKGVNKKINKFINKKLLLYLILFSFLLALILFFILRFAFYIDLDYINIIITSLSLSIFITLVLYNLLLRTKRFNKLKKGYNETLKNPLFLYSEEVKILEEYLQDLEKNNLKSIITLITTFSVPTPDVFPSKGFVTSLESYLEDVSPNILRYYEHLRGELSHFNPKREFSQLTSEATMGFIDIYLLAFYIGIKRKIKDGRKIEKSN